MLQQKSARAWRVFLIFPAVLLTSCLLPNNDEVVLSRASTNSLEPEFNIPDPCESASLTTIPAQLSATCMFYDAANQLVNPYMLSYSPQYPLWSDSAAKGRFIYLPKGTQIDTSDMENWVFPVGTRIWKEFVRNGLRVETRLMVKIATGNGVASWSFNTYQWRGDGRDADSVTAGATNVRGTPHDIPAAAQCATCHQGARDVVLGFDVLQLAQNRTDGQVTNDWLASRALVTNVAPGSVAIQGSASAKAAFGYMHANCSHCHNPLGIMPGIVLKHNLSATSMATENAYLALVPTNRVTPDSPATSRPIIRMMDRTLNLPPTTTRETFGMPPIATEIIDPAGIQAVTDWINNDI